MEQITRPDTLRSQAHDIVLKQILHGELKAGEVISLSELSANLGISRTPLREALLSLAEQGLVGIGDGNRGFYVWPLTMKEAKDLGQLAQVLEGLAVRTTEHVDAERIRQMREANQRLAEVQGQAKLMMECDNHWHELLIGATENDELRKTVYQIRKRFYRYRWYGYDYVTLHRSDEKLPSVAQHAEITDALEAGDLERAAQLVEAHWGRAISLLEKWLPKSDGIGDGGWGGR